MIHDLHRQDWYETPSALILEEQGGGGADNTIREYSDTLLYQSWLCDLFLILLNSCVSARKAVNRWDCCCKRLAG
jgi:hypothetical protein